MGCDDDVGDMGRIERKGEREATKGLCLGIECSKEKGKLEKSERGLVMGIRKELIEKFKSRRAGGRNDYRERKHEEYKDVRERGH